MLMLYKSLYLSMGSLYDYVLATYHGSVTYLVQLNTFVVKMA